mgnify:CR=1 FL=1
MTAAITSAGSAAPPMPPTAIDWQVIYPRFPLGNPAVFGHALPAAPTPKPDGETQTLIKLALLLHEAKRARNLRRNKAASSFEADLRAMRREILQRGMQ